MTKRILVLLAALALIAAACGGDGGDDTTTTEAAGGDTTTTEAMETTTTEAMETTTTEAMASDVGTADNPIRVLFVPSVSADEIIAGGEILDQTLEEATGLVFEVDVPASYAATIEEICAAPESTMGFIPAQAYVLASDLCDVSIELKAERFGYTEYWTQYIVPRDSDITSLEQLAGLTWAYPDPGSTSGFLVPSGELGNLGIEPGEGVEAGGHTGVGRAVANGEAEFGTQFFSPLTNADDEVVWDGTDETADVPADLIDSCGPDAEGDLTCGDLFVNDARAGLADEIPDVIQQVRILAISDPIPNDGVVFGPDFPEDVRTMVVDALVAFAADDPDGFEAAFDAYSWDNVATTNDAEFDSIRAIVQQLGITLDDL
jgi:phosphonate transport system substrate-binding protein